MTERARRRLGFALGGGAARGLAHLGFLAVMRREDIGADVLVGTSFGALVGGAVLAHDGDVEAVIGGVLRYVQGDQFRRSQLHFFRGRRSIETAASAGTLRDVIQRGFRSGVSMNRPSLIPPEEFQASIDAILPDRRIEDLPVTFAAIAADLATGEEVVIDRGPLRLAVQASCAIPGLVPPVTVLGRTCIDGGWVDKVPAEPARALGAEVVVAVDVTDPLAGAVDVARGFDVVVRGDAIQAHRLKTLQLARANLVVPVPLGDVDWMDFPRAQEIIDRGREAAESALPSIRSLR